MMLNNKQAFDDYSAFVQSKLSKPSADNQAFLCRLQELESMGLEASQLLTSAIGMVGESTELLELIFKPDDPDRLKILKEMGDVLFYATLAAAELSYDASFQSGTSISDQFDCVGEDAVRLVILTGRFSECVKKVMFHDKDYSAKYPELIYLSDLIIKQVGKIGGYFGLSLVDIAEANQVKLNQRYKAGFTAEEAH